MLDGIKNNKELIEALVINGGAAALNAYFTTDSQSTFEFVKGTLAFSGALQAINTVRKSQHEMIKNGAIGAGSLLVAAYLNPSDGAVELLKNTLTIAGGIKAAELVYNAIDAAASQSTATPKPRK